MKKLFPLLIMMLLVASCSKDASEQLSSKDNIYYVKYEADGGYDLVVKVKNEKGETVSRSGIDDYSEVFGPVQKGFECSISVSCTGSGSYCKISVSRNNEPFALKAYRSGSFGGSSTTYTIDY